MSSRTQQKRNRGTPITIVLPGELHTELTDSGRAGAGDDTKIIAAKITARIIELCVIEDVEELGAELDIHGFGNTSVFLQAEICVQNARAVEEAPVGCSELAQLF
jgi:hypothetical protein